MKFCLAALFPLVFLHFPFLGYFFFDLLAIVRFGQWMGFDGRVKLGSSHRLNQAVVDPGSARLQPSWDRRVGSDRLRPSWTWDVSLTRLWLS